MEKLKEYKGIYIEDNNETVKYYEHGAHFSYKALYKKLEELRKINIYNNKNINKNSYKKIFSNLKKANSQKILRYKNKTIKINISRNTNINNNSKYDVINNKAKLCKSKSINKFLNFSKSYNEDQFGSFVINKNINIKKEKEILLKKNFINLGKNQTLINNNIIKKNIKNNHTVLKYVIMPKKYINKNENEINNNYYGISPDKNINIDSDINNYGDISYNSTCNNYNNKIKNEKFNLKNNKFEKESNSQNKEIGENYKKYKKIKISSIINKRFIQKLINDSPRNNSAFLSNNNSAYYSQSKTQRTSENNIINFSSCKKQKNGCIKKFNNNNKLYNIKKSSENNLKHKINENNYYIENNNGKRLYNNNNNENILLSNNIKQKNKKLTIFNIFHKIKIQKNRIKYSNNNKNDLFLEEQKKKPQSNKTSIIKSQRLKINNNYKIQTKESQENLFIKDNYNSTSNFNNKKFKKIFKNHYSQKNVLNIDLKDNRNIPNNKNIKNNIDSLALYIDENRSNSKNKKSRNNSKNIVNLLCCHFSINFNSPINLLNNIQNNSITNNSNNKIPNITFGVNNIHNHNEIKIINKNKINRNKTGYNDSKDKKIKECKEIQEKKNILKKIKKIPIKNTKIKKNNFCGNINYDKSNHRFKRKIEQNIFKNRFNSSKRLIDKNSINNSGNNSNFNNSCYIKNISNISNKVQNNNNTFILNNIKY